jgi:quinol-cytochrome oxidoreductase complex cytochrome b subunit
MNPILFHLWQIVVIFLTMGIIANKPVATKRLTQFVVERILLLLYKARACTLTIISTLKCSGNDHTHPNNAGE